MGYEEALAAFRCGDNAEATRLAQIDLDQATAGKDIEGRVDALCRLARVALRDGRLTEVEARAVEAGEVAEGSDDRRLQRMPIHLRAVAARMAGRPGDARELYRRSIELNDQLGEILMAAVEHRNLAYVEIQADDLERGRHLFAEARRRLAGLDAPVLKPYLIFDEATVAALDGDYARPSAKLAEAERDFQEQGVLPDPDDASEIAALRRRLGLANR